MQEVQEEKQPTYQLICKKCGKLGAFELSLAYSIALSHSQKPEHLTHLLRIPSQAEEGRSEA